MILAEFSTRLAIGMRAIISHLRDRYSVFAKVFNDFETDRLDQAGLPLRSG
jgi:hypothetical protein